jgi:uncharacterized protein YdcH (DUF465 family)
LRYFHQIDDVVKHAEKNNKVASVEEIEEVKKLKI